MDRGMLRVSVLALAVSLVALGALPAAAVAPGGDRDGVWMAVVDLFSGLWQGFIITRDGTGIDEFTIIQDGAGGSDAFSVGDDSDPAGGLRALSAADGTEDPPDDGFRGGADPDG